MNTVLLACTKIQITDQLAVLDQDTGCDATDQMLYKSALKLYQLQMNLQIQMHKLQIHLQISCDVTAKSTLNL